MNIEAKIKGIAYVPLLCRKLNVYDFDDIDKAITRDASFLLKTENSQIALSWWVSAKRTRSYPYTRVYDTLYFSGKKVTIIPVMKDEGKDGDRDFLQWDTVSLMSLLGFYVIIAYYKTAIKNTDYDNKITEQRFDYKYLKDKIKELLAYQSDALHWNLSQMENIGKLAKKALQSYHKIAKNLNIEMHSKASAEQRLEELLKDKESFMNFSRDLAKKAQKRESETIQPKENLDGIKAMLTIKNYLGGNYYFTSDEVKIEGKNLFLIEGKHTENDKLPALEDIKDGLLKMVLFCNLKNVKIDRSYNPIPTLKLTTGRGFDINSLSDSQKDLLNQLKKEAKVNGFRIIINDRFFI